MAKGYAAQSTRGGRLAAPRQRNTSRRHPALRFSTILGAVLVLALAAPMTPVFSQAVKFFRIGTGSTGGTYHPIGGLIASTISNPPGARP